MSNLKKDTKTNTNQERDDFNPHGLEHAQKAIGDHHIILKDSVASPEPSRGEHHWNDVAKEHFGVTHNPKEAGYILHDGQMLDLSGKRDGGEPNTRTMDHRDLPPDILDQVRADHAGDVGPTDAMLHFIHNTGALRYSPEGQAVESLANPSDKQIRNLTKMHRGDPREIHIEASTGLGSKNPHYKHFERPKFQDLRDWFDNYYAIHTNETDEDLEKGAKDRYMQMFPHEPEKHAPVVDWAHKTFKKQDRVTWYLKNYKKNPEIHNEQNVKDLEHHASMLDQFPQLGKEQFHPDASFDSQINKLKTNESNLMSKLSESAVEPSGKEIVPVNKDYSWYDLGRGSCTVEGKAMGHCGNEPSEVEGDTIYSLRKKVKTPLGERHEPHLTFIANQKWLGEMKGRGNEKPTQKYHPHIIKLLKSPHVDYVLGGGYAAEKNFSLHDLNDTDRQELLTSKPGLDPWAKTPKKINPKHKKDFKEILDFKKKIAKKHNIKPNDNPAFTNAVYRHLISPQEHEAPDTALNLLPNLSNEHLGEIAQKNNNHNIAIHALMRAKSPDIIRRGLSNRSMDVREAAIKHPNATADHISQALKDEDDDVRQAAIKHPNATADHISQALKDEDDDVRQAAIKHPNATADHISQALSDEKRMVRQAVIEHPKATAEHISQALGDDDKTVRETAIKHPNATPQHISQALSDEKRMVRQAAIMHPKATAQHISQALSDEDWMVRQAAIKHPNATAQHISQALKDKERNIRKAAIRHSKATAEDISQALKDEDDDVRWTAIKHPNATAQHISQASSDEKRMVRQAAIEHPNATAEHISQALGDEHVRVHRAAIERPNVTPEHISQALSDRDKSVRRVAIRHPKATSDHISQALSDEDWMVRQAAIKRPNVTPEHISQALSDKDKSVRRVAIRHPKATSDHISQASSDEEGMVRQAAIEHPNATAKHINQALSDKDWQVRKAAIRHSKATAEDISQALKDEHPDVRQSATEALSKLSLNKSQGSHLPDEHVLMISESPVYAISNHDVKTITDLHKELNRLGEMATPVQGQYGGQKENSLMIHNPKNLTAIFQIAKDLEQESILHHHKGQSRLHYVNGPHAGSVHSGHGTQFHSETPTDNYSTTQTDEGPVHFSHNIDFSAPPTKPTTDLKKAPLEEPQDHLLPLGMGATPETHLGSTPVAGQEGLYFHSFGSRGSPRGRVHHLSRSSDPRDEDQIIGMMSGHQTMNPDTKEKLFRVNRSYVTPKERGRGVGKILYGEAAKHHGSLVSDKIVSPTARGVYEHFVNNPDHPDYKAQIGEIVTHPDINLYDNHGDVSEQESVRATYGTPHYLRHAGDRSSKLAASADKKLKKEDLRYIEPTPGTKPVKQTLHGWMNPQGEYHHMEPNEAHNEFADNHFGFGMTQGVGPSPYSVGYVSFGHGGFPNIRGPKSMLADRSHPMNSKIRQLVGERLHPIDDMVQLHFEDGGGMTMHVDDYVKGKFGKRGGIQ